MPLETARYGPNWVASKTEYKAQLGWKCQRCGKPCREKGETMKNFLNRIPLDLRRVAQIKPKTFELHLAHLDQNPSNDVPENWEALCTVCHLEHDRPFIAANQMARRERNGQLSLFA